MGAYKEETIERDFELVLKGTKYPGTSLILEAAKVILQSAPDDMSRDLAISHLLQAAGWVETSCFLDSRRSEWT